MKLKECIAPEGAKRAAFQRTDAKEHESHNEGEFFSDIFFFLYNRIVKSDRFNRFAIKLEERFDFL